MSNEDKSREIANNNCTHANCSHGEHYFTSELDCYKAAMEMAEWKDNQAAAAYCKCCDTRECEDYESDTCDWLEKFKKILKGGKE